MKKLIIATGTMLCLAACQVQTASRIADYGRVYECVELPEKPPLWTAGGKEIPEFSEGKTGLYHRCGRDLYTFVMAPEPRGTFTPIADAPAGVQQVVQVSPFPYRWKATPTTLPADAGQVTGRVADVFLQELGDDRVIPTGETHATAHAVWAYPLAAVSFVAIDIPCTLTSVVCFGLSMSFAELGLEIGNTLYGAALQLQPETDE